MDSAYYIEFFYFVDFYPSYPDIPQLKQIEIKVKALLRQVLDIHLVNNYDEQRNL